MPREDQTSQEEGPATGCSRHRARKGAVHGPPLVPDVDTGGLRADREDGGRTKPKEQPRRPSKAGLQREEGGACDDSRVTRAAAPGPPPPTLGKCQSLGPSRMWGSEDGNKHEVLILCQTQA